MGNGEGKMLQKTRLVKTLPGNESRTIRWREILIDRSGIPELMEVERYCR
jgi:hypothetical protein